MVHFAISRVLWLLPTLLAMALVTFLVMHATPGSPLDPVAEGANPLSPEAQRNLAEHYGLDVRPGEEVVDVTRDPDSGGMFRIAVSRAHDDQTYLASAVAFALSSESCAARFKLDS